MKLFSLATLILMSGTLMAKECVDLSGKYRMHAKTACSEKSLKSIDLGDGYEAQVGLAEHWATHSGGHLYLDLQEEYNRFDIKQDGCDKLQITYEKTVGNPPMPDNTILNYEINEKNILANGFKFKDIDSAFFDTFGPTHVKNTFKIIQDENDKTKLRISSKYTHVAAIFFIIPFFKKGAFVDCTLEKVE